MAEHITPNEELDKQIKQAMAVGRLEPKAVSAYYAPKKGRIVVELDSGVTFMFPAELAQGLADADFDALLGLYWPSLDVDLSISGLLAGIFGSPSWMFDLYVSLGKKGGSKKSEVKAQAARTNGKLGGRPRQKTG